MEGQNGITTRTISLQPVSVLLWESLYFNANNQCAPKEKSCVSRNVIMSLKYPQLAPKYWILYYKESEDVEFRKNTGCLFYFFPVLLALCWYHGLKKKSTQLSVIFTNRFCLGKTMEIVEKEGKIEWMRNPPRESN